MAHIKRDGPYGDKSAEQNIEFKEEEDEHITEIIVRSGNLVDGIGFTKVGDGNKPITKMYGGNGGHLYKIVLDRGEAITGISGKSKGSEMYKLKIHTSSCPSGHGPFGDINLAGGSEFTSKPLKDDETVIGFFGAHKNDLIASLGLYVLKVRDLEFMAVSCGSCYYYNDRPMLSFS